MSETKEKIRQLIDTLYNNLNEAVKILHDIENCLEETEECDNIKTKHKQIFNRYMEAAKKI